MPSKNQRRVYLQIRKNQRGMTNGQVHRIRKPIDVTRPKDHLPSHPCGDLLYSSMDVENENGLDEVELFDPVIDL